MQRRGVGVAAPRTTRSFYIYRLYDAAVTAPGQPRDYLSSQAVRVRRVFVVIDS